MPNWCYNNLVVRGTEDDVDAFVKESDVECRGPLSFYGCVPMPDDLKVTSGSLEMGYDALYGDYQRLLDSPWIKKAGVTNQEELVAFLEKEKPVAMEAAETYKRNVDLYGYTTWYRWSIANWGTKWDAKSASVEKRFKGYVEYSFDTAWCPPEQWLLTTSEKHSRLHFVLQSRDEMMPECIFEAVIEGGQVLYTDQLSFPEPELKTAVRETALNATIIIAFIMGFAVA